MLNSQDGALEAILERYSQLCIAHKNVQENADRLQAHERDLMAQISDCFAAARVFGFDLVAEFQRSAQNISRQLDLKTPEPRTANLADIPPVAAARSEPTIRDLVLSAIRKAHPKAVRASTIRRELANLGHATHEKTVGMTLYRLSKDGLTRRVGGRDWYLAPEAEHAEVQSTLAGKLEPDTAVMRLL